jgi:putative Mg2+ transporter-C (MgtC) family protein
MTFGESVGQGWLQLAELGLAFVLSALIGLERELRQKSAGLRTHTLVGIASALIMLVSKYGFMDVLAEGRIVLDPSRVAAQVVSGIGFIGGGLIFVHRDNVRGLTTAAVIWLTAAVGMACGAGLPILALAVVAGHFSVVFLFGWAIRHLPRSRWSPSVLHVTFHDGGEVLQDVLVACTERDFAVSRVHVQRSPSSPEASGQLEPLAQTAAQGIAVAVLEVQGVKSVSKLAARLSAIDGVVSVHAGDSNVPSE